MTAYISHALVRYATVFIVAHFCAGSALALKLKIVPDESEMPSCGAMVGYLEFENDGSEPCRISGKLAYLTIEIECPDGVRVGLRPNEDREEAGPSPQLAELDQGDWVRHPLCLLKHEGAHIFENAGRYRIRAKYRTLAVQSAPDDGPVVVTTSGHRGDSDWVEINVSAPLRGRPNYVNSHKWNNLVGAFRGDMAEIKARLGDSMAYRREQEKLLVYQEGGGVGTLVRGRIRDENALKIARANLLRAKRVGVGVEMWEWIVARLAELPADSTNRTGYDARGGYIF